MIREDLAAYYDEIHRFDCDFGRVLARFEEAGLADNTLVVFMGGGNGGAQFMGKGTLYEYGVNVPLIIRWPGKIAPGSRTERLISGEDLAPTFLAAAGIEPPKEMTGCDIDVILWIRRAIVDMYLRSGVHMGKDSRKIRSTSI